MSIVVCRHFGNCPITNLEYLLDSKGQKMIFDNEYNASKFLVEKGLTEEEIATVIFEKVKGV